jgi:hypothetical protein
MKTRTKNPDALIGWREWIGFPDFGTFQVKAKIDTGARTSAIHATNIEAFERDGRQLVRFCLFPHQDDHQTFVECVAPMTEKRVITDSGGHEEERFVITSEILLGETRWTIEMSLTQRDDMGFRMLLGRTAIRGRFLVNPGASYMAGKPADTQN